jgi:hypothetical protein
MSVINKALRVFEDFKRAEMKEQKEQEEAALALLLLETPVQSTEDLSVWMYNLRF